MVSDITPTLPSLLGQSKDEKEIAFQKSIQKNTRKPCLVLDEAPFEWSKVTGDRKKVYKQYLKSKEWKAKRKETLAFHGKKCKRCPAFAKDIHHKTYENIFNEKVEDLEPLCRKCHADEHGLKVHIPQKKKANRRKKPQKPRKKKPIISAMDRLLNRKRRAENRLRKIKGQLKSTEDSLKVINAKIAAHNLTKTQ